MTKLLFIRQPHVYLPEIPAYKAYLAKHHPHIKVFESTEISNYNALDFDILWHFMGMDTKGKGAYVVHEYNSFSTPPLISLKNHIKKIFNSKPDRRIFLNRLVSHEFNFNDGVPEFYRDMGVNDTFLEIQRTDPQYDFIYAGGLDRGIIIEKTLKYIISTMKDATILLVGDAPKKLERIFKGHKNISFSGRVPYSEIPTLMAKARFGLNIMPNKRPFNIQTATKVLEYSAAGLPIITTNYKWINEFEEKYQAKCFKLSPDTANLSQEALDKFDFIIPNMQDLVWEKIITESNVFSFLQ